MSASVGMGLHAQRIQVLADGGHGELAAAGNNVAIDQHQGELGIWRQRRAVGVEEVVIGDGTAVPYRARNFPPIHPARSRHVSLTPSAQATGAPMMWIGVEVVIMCIP